MQDIYSRIASKNPQSSLQLCNDYGYDPKNIDDVADGLYSIDVYDGGSSDILFLLSGSRNKYHSANGRVHGGDNLNYMFKKHRPIVESQIFNATGDATSTPVNKHKITSSMLMVAGVVSVVSILLIARN